ELGDEVAKGIDAYTALIRGTVTMVHSILGWTPCGNGNRPVRHRAELFRFGQRHGLHRNMEVDLPTAGWDRSRRSANWRPIHPREPAPPPAPRTNRPMPAASQLFLPCIFSWRSPWVNIHGRYWADPALAAAHTWAAAARR